MILVDTGPLVALFDPQDRQHARCKAILKSIREPIATTIPVLTEAFHMLGSASIGSDRLREFVASGGLMPWFFDRNDFETYRVRRGHRHQSIQIVS